MLTLSELKYYNKFDGNDNDVFFQSCIDMAVSNIESKVMRKFVYSTYTEYFNFDLRGYYSYWTCDYYGNGGNNTKVFLSNMPVDTLVSLFKLVDNEYVTIFEGSDTIANSVNVNSTTGEVTLMNGYSFPYGNNSTQIVYKAGYKFSQLTGTVSNSANSNTVTGTGTSFNTELAVGHKIIIGNERRTVTVITDATHLTVDFNFINANTTGTTAYINNYPDDLRKFCLELATWIYMQSPHSDLNLLGVTSLNQGGQSQIGKSVSEPNWSDIIANYKIWNV